MNIENINFKIEEFIKERDWDQFHTVKNLVMALTVESAELQEIFQWMSDKESNEIKNNPNVKVNIQDEVADIFIYLLRIIKKTDINLEEAIYNKIEKNRLKYPIELAKGNYKKYTEFK
ncbi:MAG: nucleotide pyrophosphohydrolase [Bacteriovoracaceae bacterium]